MMHEDKEFSDFDDDLGHNHTTYHGHDHSHSHGHDGSCSHESHRATSSWKNGASEDSHDHDHDHENGEEEKIKFDDVVNVVQFGAKVHLITLLQQYRDLVHQRDSKGNTLMHWAAKRGSVDILQAIFELGGKIDIASTAEPNMLPIHWAAADGKIDAIAFLLSKGQDINAQDTNGSSPAVIAAQYGQVNTIIYLYKHSADLTLSDHSGDHVLHWAAYKGNDEILQLMLYLYPREVNISDRFGQTALHLGALRGYANIVETLLKKYQADYTLRDKSGNTPLELSIEKKQNHIEFLIKRLTIKNTFELYRKVFSEDRKFLMPTLFGADDYEKCVWQWRLTFYSNLYATICLLQLTFSELLSDLFYLHTVNIIIVLFWWVFFFGCLWKDPGYITGNPYKNAKNTSNNGNNGVNHKKYPFEQGDIEEARECLLPSDQENSLYEKGLDIIGRVESSHYNPVLCHTCHVERPLRSKHDRFTNKCVHKFDHFCPFVYNAIGRDNYRFFTGLLLLHPIAYTGYVIENIYYYIRTPDPISYLYYAFFVYSIAMCIMVMTLGFYHLRLIEYNLTTNEFSNQKKYDYLQDELTQQYHNPFNMNRSVWLNCMDVCVPSQKVYYTRNDAIRGELRADSVMSDRNV